MIGDNLTPRTNRILRVSGTLVVLVLYLCCIRYARTFTFYAVVCGPLVTMLWVFGNSLYDTQEKKKLRQQGRLANFSMPLSMGYSVHPVEEELRPDPHPGGDGSDFQARPQANQVFRTNVTNPTSVTTQDPVVHVSRYRKVSDQDRWVV